MVFVRRPEIRVAGEIVGEEADADRKRNEAPGERESVELGGVEELRVLEVALDESLEILPAREHLVEILLVLGGGGGRRADHIAEVVERGAGHYRIEIDHGDALLRHVVEHDVVDLSVVVGDALGDLAARHRVDDPSGLFAARVDEIHLALNEFKAVLHVGRGGLVEKLKTVDRVVELGQNLVETRLGEIGERVLELREGVRREKGLIGVLDKVDRARARDERVKTPGILVAEDLERSAALRADMARHAADVLHHAVGIGKDVGVDALKDVRNSADVVGLEGVVDVARTVSGDLDDVGNAERRENRKQLFFAVCAIGHVVVPCIG